MICLNSWKYRINGQKKVAETVEVVCESIGKHYERVKVVDKILQIALSNFFFKPLKNGEKAQSG